MEFDRRRFLQGLGGTAVAAVTLGWPTRLAAAIDSLDSTEPPDSPEALARELHRRLSDAQRAEIAFPWDHVDGDRGLLRARVSANWNITEPELNSDFFTSDQRALVRTIFEGLIDPGWHERYYRQLRDDAGGWGRHQSIGLFGDPDDGPFLFVMTGRHLTLRAGGGDPSALAFGGPIFYGHATGTWWSGASSSAPITRATSSSLRRKQPPRSTTCSTGASRRAPG